MVPRYPGWCWDDKQSNLGPGRPVFRPPKCSVRPSGRARGRPQAGPQAGPKMAQNAQKRTPVPPWGASEDSVVHIDGHNQLGYCLGSLWAVFDSCWTHVAPKRCPLGPKWVHLGPECVPRAETKKWPYLGLDGPNCESVNTFPTCKPPLQVGPTHCLVLSWAACGPRLGPRLMHVGVGCPPCAR